MTISLHDVNNGGVFDRLGLFGGILADVESIRGGAASTNVLAAANMLTRVANCETYWKGTTDNRQVIDGIYSALTSFQGAQSSYLSALKTYAAATMVKMADQDSPLPAGKSITDALNTLITQMKSAAASVNASTVGFGAQTAAGSPNGNPIILLSAVRGDGLIQQTVFPETLTFRCSADSQGSATKNQEPFTVNGQAAVSDTLDYLWPGGSGVSSSLSAVDSTQNNSGGNVLYNSDFETWTNANIPDNWVKDVGTIGTTILQGGSANAYTGSYALEFAGNGSELTQVHQQFNTTPSTSLGVGGTNYALLPDTVYAVNFWIKMSATPAAGVLVCDLYDNGGAAVINDDQANANSISKSLTTVSTSWVNVNGFFRTPKVLPTTIYLRLRLSTAITNTDNLFIDRLAITPAKQLYAGGPLAAIFSGNTKLIQGDTWTLAVTNTMGGFAKLFERFFGLRNLTPTGQSFPLQLPYSGSPTVSDTLIA